MSIKYSVLFWILLQLPMTFCTFQFGLFDIEENTRILNNYLNIIKEAETVILCGIKCAEHPQCTAATYENVTSSCRLHFYNNSDPLITELYGGIKTIKIKGYRKRVDMKFDTETLHSKLYLSPDTNVLSSRLSDRVVAWPPGRNQLTKYPGAVSTYCVSPGQKLYYEFQYEYDLQVPRTGNLIVFEFGIADKTTVDNSVYCGSSLVDGWSFPINACLGATKICIEAWRKSRGYLETPLGINIAGVYKSGTFAVMVNRVDNTFSLFHKQSNTMIFSFTNVISSAILCPAFSIDTNVNATFTMIGSFSLK